MLRAEDVAWLGFWAGFAALDYWASKRDASLCGTARHMFHTDTKPGRLALTAGLFGGAYVLRKHVLK